MDRECSLEQPLDSAVSILSKMLSDAQVSRCFLKWNVQPGRNACGNLAMQVESGEALSFRF